MAVNVPNSIAYQQQLGNHCAAFRDALQDLLKDSTYITAMGGTTFLTTTLGLSSNDATTIMNTVGSVTPTNSIVITLQAFIASTAPLWGSS